MENLREALLERRLKKAEKRGSVFVTVLIILIFAIGGVFYLKTAKPDIYNAAVECIKNIGYETVQKLNNNQNDLQTENSNEKPEGELLRSADDLEFCYLSTALTERFKTGSFAFMPVKNAVVTSNFGTRTDPVTNEKMAGHHGIDLAAAKGSKIFAFDSGFVEKTGSNDIYGNYVIINHRDLQSFYGHLSEISVSDGQNVNGGEVIGIIGSTGKSTGTHLHFEIRKNGVRVDPAEYIYEEI